MDQGIVNVRYAKAFFSLSKEKNLLEDTKADMELVTGVCRVSKDFIHLLENPVVKTSKKKELIALIFGEKINKLSLDFLNLILDNKREGNIPGICRNFLDMVKRDQGIQTAVITLATKISDKSFENIKTILEKNLGSKIELSGKVNPAIIGGMILRIDDRQFDGSISTQLKKIKILFLETEVK